jgi:hypothetical protein
MPEHIATARKLRSSIPSPLYQSAHSPDGALFLAIALAIGDDQATAGRQLHLVRERLGRERGAVVEDYYRQVLEAGAEYRLALLEISFPLLRNRPAQQLEFLIELVRSLLQMDGRISLSEYCYFRVLKSHLGQAISPRAREPRNRVGKRKAQSAAITLISIIAEQGNDDPQAQQRAREAGLQQFGSWVDVASDAVIGAADSSTTIEQLEQSLDTLSQINPAGRQTLLKAVTETITHDGSLSLAEAELLRTICASLNCPLPPLMESRHVSARAGPAARK